MNSDVGEQPLRQSTAVDLWEKRVKLAVTFAVGVPCYFVASGLVDALVMHAAVSVIFLVFAFIMDAATAVERIVLAIIFTAIVIFALLIGERKRVQREVEKKPRNESRLMTEPGQREDYYRPKTQIAQILARNCRGCFMIGNDDELRNARKINSRFRGDVHQFISHFFRPVYGPSRAAVLGPPLTAGIAAENSPKPRSRGFSSFGFSLLAHSPNREVISQKLLRVHGTESGI